MNRDDILRMAREAGFQTLLPDEHIDGNGGVYVGDDDIAEFLERFAALVAAAEREACAQIIQSYMDNEYIGDPGWNVARDILNDIQGKKK